MQCYETYGLKVRKRYLSIWLEILEYGPEPSNISSIGLVTVDRIPTEKRNSVRSARGKSRDILFQFTARRLRVVARADGEKCRTATGERVLGGPAAAAQLCIYTASSLLIWVIERARRRWSMIVTGDSGRSCCRRSLRPVSTARVRAYGPTWLAKSRRELATTCKQITAVDSFSSTFTSFHAVAAPPAESLVRTAGTELNRTPDTCIPVKGSRRTNWLSTSRPSFAAANPVVRLTRVTNERVVQLGWLAAGQFSSFLVLWN